MKKRFILVIDNPTKEQQNAVTQFFKNQLGYWHWFSDVWLLTDSSNTWTAVSLRDKVKELVPGARLLVFMVESNHTWAAFGKEGMFNWLDKTWKR